MHKVIRKLGLFGLVILVCFTLVSCDSFRERGIIPDRTVPQHKSGFSITFIDVGQGDAALVSCDGHYMLVDGGPKSGGTKVAEVLDSQNIKELDYLIISHMHEDHIGGLDEALRHITKVGKAFSVQTYHDSKAFRDFSSELRQVDGCKTIEIPQVGQEYKLGSAKIEIMAVGNPNDNILESGDPEEYDPEDDDSEEYKKKRVSNNSLVILVTYKNTSFLFTGDMPFEMEDEFVDKYSQRYAQRESDINSLNPPIILLKVSHHGSGLSTKYRFLDMLLPQYAIISVGEGNRYGHPSESVLSILRDARVDKVYRTDQDGTITVRSDGKNLTFDTEK